MKGEGLNKADLRYIKSIEIKEKPKKITSIKKEVLNMYVDCNGILHYKRGTLIINK